MAIIFGNWRIVFLLFGREVEESKNTKDDLEIVVIGDEVRKITIKVKRPIIDSTLDTLYRVIGDRTKINSLMDVVKWEE